MRHNRCCGSHGFLSDENRCARSQTAKPVVVDNLQNLRFFNPLDSLAAFIMVNQNYFPVRLVHNYLAVDRPYIFALFQNWITDKPCFSHFGAYVYQRVRTGKAYDVLGHQEFHRHALVNQTSCGISIIRGVNNDGPNFFSQRQNLWFHLVVSRYDKARCRYLQSS